MDDEPAGTGMGTGGSKDASYRIVYWGGRDGTRRGRDVTGRDVNVFFLSFSFFQFSDVTRVR